MSSSRVPPGMLGKALPPTSNLQQKASSQSRVPPQPTASRAPKQVPAPAPIIAPTNEHDKNSDVEDEKEGDGDLSENHAPAEHPFSDNPSREHGGSETGQTVMIKVISLAVSAGKLSQMPITSLEYPIETRASFISGTKLGDLRQRLTGVLSKGRTFAFCSDEGAITSSEDISLATYIKTLHIQTESEDEFLYVFIAATTEPAASQASTLLQPPFQLKFIQIGDSPSDALNTGSLHSTSFNGKDPSGLPLGELRRMIGKMSTSPKMHVFCSTDGSAAGDELTLSQYLNLDKEGVHEKEGTPSILIRYRKADAKVSAAASKFHGASPEVLAAMERMRPDLTFKDHSAEEFKVDKTGFRVQEELDASRFAARDANPAKYTSQMDEADWDAVLRNCSLLYGWKINKKTKKMERATTPAFRLRAKNPAPVPFVPPTQSPTPIDPSVSLGGPSTTKAIENSSGSTTSSTMGSNGNNAHTPTTSGSAFEKAVHDDSSSNSVVAAQPPPPAALTAEDIAASIPTKLGAIPSYVINDQSKIQITTVSSEFQESMAKNHFDSTSVEASVSGGYGGFSVGVTGGYSSENSSKQVNTSKTFSKRMIGSYMFPRVSVFLRPEDLEPTQELQQALQLVQATKDINNLRKLYTTFGHLFCHAVTLGGCLQTTKIVTGTQQSAETEEKEAFKASVGVAVSTPFGVGGSVKTSHENSDSTANFSQQTNTSESMAFEATGGNSILAADPPAWSGSVADFNNWRVIDQTELTPIANAIADMVGYSEVKSWFISAVPKLSQYLVVPESRTLHVRFKVANQGDGFQHITGRSEQAYLGVDPARPPKPIRTSLQRLAPEQEIHANIRDHFFYTTVDLTYSTKQVDVHKTDAMFFPHSTQAPVLLFPKGDEVGTKQDQTLMQTVWRLEVAQGYSLGPESLVCVKSCAPVRAAPDKDPQQADLALTVYRNAQGVFMPALTSSDEPSYWRLRRINDTAPGGVGAKHESFRHGEVFRLTWAFADQASGFRDYLDDTYGRRSFHKPADLPVDTLCLKMPYPRFENTSDTCGISLVMSAALTADPIVQTFKVRRSQDEGPGPDNDVNYNLHDVAFRMDYVGNEGAGDSSDFMNVVTAPHEEKRETHTWEGTGYNPFALLPMGSPEAMLAGVLLGPMASPIAGIGSLLDAIIGF